MAVYQGDFAPNQVVDIKWNSYNSLGAPVTISAGTVRIHANNSSTSWSTGITDTANLMGTGDHLIRISLASSTTQFTVGNTFHVFRSGDSIDGQFFAGTIATFSIMHRADSIATFAELLSAPVADGATANQQIQWVYQLSRTSLTQTGLQAVLSSSNKSSIATSTVTDDGTTYQRRGWV